MGTRLYDDEKMKTLILYLLNELDDEFEFDTVSEIIAWDGTINYFVFNDCFFKLVEAGAISARDDAESGKVLYSISPEGRHSLSMVEDNIIGFVKDKIMRSATRLLAFKKNGSNISCEIVPQKGGGYNLNCKIENKNGSLMNLSLYLDNPEEAERMKQGFDDRAENIYGGILSLFMGDFRYYENKK